MNLTAVEATVDFKYLILSLRDEEACHHEHCHHNKKKPGHNRIKLLGMMRKTSAVNGNVNTEADEEDRTHDFMNSVPEPVVGETKEKEQCHDNIDKKSLSV